MAYHNEPFLLYFVSLVIISFLYVNEAALKLKTGDNHREYGVGVTIDLIHPDSPLSPSYNASETRFDRAKKSLSRSLARHSYIASVLSGNPTTAALQAPLVGSGGGYLMRIGIGTPPFKIWAVADTGSDLAWTQCQPCQECFKQDAPLFDPRNSSTYEILPCSSQQCQSLGRSGSCDKDGCGYQFSYGDRSFSKGTLSTETLTFDSSDSKNTAEFPNFVFGCGHDDDGSFDSNTSGIIGLGGGSVSIVRQLDKAISGKFSYCLANPNANATSKISFGSDAVVSGPGVLSTPIIKGSEDTFYYLTLNGISVGSKRLAFKSFNRKQTSGDEGNIIIDSGTTLTFLPSDMYDEFSSALQQSIKARRVDATQGFDLCYAGTGELGAPPVTAHFAGADLLLPQETIFIEVEQAVVCSTFASSSSLGVAIFGNLHQVNYQVGYDLQAGTVSFKKTDCSKNTK